MSARISIHGEEHCIRNSNHIHKSKLLIFAITIILSLPTSALCQTIPVINSVSPIEPKQNQTIIIKGNGLGSHQPYNNQDCPYILINDESAGWNAGFESSNYKVSNTLNKYLHKLPGHLKVSNDHNAITLNVESWTNEIIKVSGFAGAFGSGTFNLNNGDRINVTVWNPQSGSKSAAYILIVKEELITPDISETKGYNTPPNGDITTSVSPNTQTPNTISSEESNQNNSVSFQLPVNVPWYDTGIKLNKGENIMITANGKVKISLDASSYQTPSGSPGSTQQSIRTINPFLAGNLPLWSLIGRIGSSGTPFEVGTGTTMTASTSGELFLSINDNVFGDNSGNWNVTLIRQIGKQEGLGIDSNLAQPSFLFTDLSDKYNYKITVLKSSDIALSVIDKQSLKQIQEIFWEIPVPEDTSSITIGSHITNSAYDNHGNKIGGMGFQDFIIADLNFDGLEDIALKSGYISGGITYDFLIQDENGVFKHDPFFPDIYDFPEINKKNLTLTSCSYMGSGQIHEIIYKYNMKTKKWKIIKDVTQNSQ